MANSIRFTGFARASLIALEAAQGGLTSAAETGPAGWGADDEAPSGGPISIITERSTLMIAPDSVIFRVDTSTADFDTPYQPDPELYDQRYHDLVYLWDFGTGETDVYTAPVNVLASWKKANVAYGPFVAKMFTRDMLDGLASKTFTVGLTVIEPSSGKVSSTTIDITVSDPDSAFTAATTYVVATDGDFTGAPAHDPANEFTRLVDAMTAATTDVESNRVLFKRGQTFSMAGWNDTVNNNFRDHYLLGDWGTGTKPVIDMVPAAADAYFLFTNFNFNHVNIDRTSDVRIENLKFIGDYDATTASGDTTKRIYYARSQIFSAISGVDVDGVGAQIAFGFQIVGSVTAFNPPVMHLHDSSITNYGTYPLYYSPAVHTKVLFTGFRGAQNPDAHGEAGGATFRNGWSDVYIDGSDFFHNSGKPTNVPQQPLRMFDTPPTKDNGEFYHGAFCNIQRTSVEGAAKCFSITSNHSEPQRSARINALYEHCVFVKHVESEQVATVNSPGMTFRSNLVVIPGAPTAVKGTNFWFHMGANDASGIASGSPTKIYNNTFVCLRTTVQNEGRVPNLNVDNLNAGWWDNSITIENNIEHYPNLDTPVVAAAPLDDTSPVLWVPRYKGDNTGGVLDSRYAPPVGSLRTFAPVNDPGGTGVSSAIGAATSGLSAFDSIRLVVRPMYPSKGAWEVIAHE